MRERIKTVNKLGSKGEYRGAGAGGGVQGQGIGAGECKRLDVKGK